MSVPIEKPTFDNACSKLSSIDIAFNVILKTR